MAAAARLASEDVPRRELVRMGLDALTVDGEAHASFVVAEPLLARIEEHELTRGQKGRAIGHVVARVEAKAEPAGLRTLVYVIFERVPDILDARERPFPN